MQRAKCYRCAAVRVKCTIARDARRANRSLFKDHSIRSRKQSDCVAPLLRLPSHELYGDGRVTSDFVGLARRRRQQAEPDHTRMYFTGCAGNVAAGKYNDGSHDARVALTNKIHDAMVESDAAIQSSSVHHVTWRTVTLTPPTAKRSKLRITTGANEQQTRLHCQSQPTCL